jgi:hypothetical protein
MLHVKLLVNGDMKVQFLKRTLHQICARIIPFAWLPLMGPPATISEGKPAYRGYSQCPPEPILAQRAKIKAFRFFIFGPNLPFIWSSDVAVQLP